jgi:hypothetical protein
MAAGLGFKDFVTGEVLTANDVDGYLMQGVWVFANAAARTAAVTSPQEGNMSYLKDTNSTEYYSGSAWVGISGGLNLVNSTTFSAVSSQSLNSVFSATYDNYRIVISYTAAGAASPVQVKMRMRASGSDNTGTYYTANYYYYGGTFTDLSYETNAGFLAGYASNNTTEGPSLAVIDIMNPFAASPTVMQGEGQTFLSNLGHSYAQRFSGTSFAATSFDGFTLIPASSTITGKVRVYGYSN